MAHRLLNNYHFGALQECWNTDIIESRQSEQEPILGIINMKINTGVFFKLHLSKTMGNLYFANNLGYPSLCTYNVCYFISGVHLQAYNLHEEIASSFLLK